MAQANGNGFVTLYLSTLYSTNDQIMVKKWPRNKNNKLVSIFHINFPMSFLSYSCSCSPMFVEARLRKSPSGPGRPKDAARATRLTSLSDSYLAPNCIGSAQHCSFFVLAECRMSLAS